jgi:hypothetical protein
MQQAAPVSELRVDSKGRLRYNGKRKNDRYSAGKDSEAMTKYIFVTGGVVSSVGKGVTAASIGRILKSRGIAVSIQKLDPYINVDPGTMSPYQHGEVYVT